ncbi:MAG: STAS domain-containing protein [Kiloniellaceae bacterium]
MQISYETIDGVAILGVTGAVDSHAAGQLSDALVQCISGGAKKMIVNLSGVHIMTRAGFRGLVVAAKLMETAQGEMRICGALRSVDDFLRRSGFTYLLTCDVTLQASLNELRAAPRGVPERPAMPLLQAI